MKAGDDRRPPTPADVSRTAAEAMRLAADVDDQLKLLHRPDAGDKQAHCRTCVDALGRPELYPCPTLRSVRRLMRLRKVIR